MAFQTDTRLSRQKQINTLKVFNELVECVTEGTEYRIPVRGPNETPLHLSVRLMPDFPASQPQVFVQPAVHHPWVEPSTGRVTTAPGLLNFSPHSDLGMVVQAVRRELEKAESLQAVQQAGGPATTDLVVARLAGMTEEELHEALESDVALEKLLLSLAFPPLQALEENIQSMQEVIKVTAETNIALEAEIEASRDALLCKVEEYHTCKLSLAQVLAKVKALQARVEGSVLADRLVRLSVDNEEKSDAIADRFLAKEIGVEEFLTDYVKTRQQSHLQKLKADKVKTI